MNENIHDILHGNKWTMFHGLPIVVLGPSISKGIQTYVAVPPHGPLSLTLSLRAHQLDFYFPQYGILMIFKGTWIFTLMALGMCGK